MNISNKYIQDILRVHPQLNETIIKKDLILSYILQGLAKADNLIFKGGTCLSKCYLNYHRLSEDLDFNLELPINSISSITQTRKTIREYFKKKFLPKLQIIADKYNLDFDQKEFNTQEQRYCPVKQGDNIFRFHIYSDKKDMHPIKIEINISETIIYKPIKKVVFNLIKESKYLTYPLMECEIDCYDLREIVLEKIRAILTRPEGIHERDIFDLFLINKLNNIFLIKKNELINKIENSFLYDSRLVNKRILELNDYILFQEMTSLAIIKFDRKEYSSFFKRLVKLINKNLN